MGLLNFLKGGAGNTVKRGKEEDMWVYLVNARNNLKLASEHMGKFLEDTKEFQPARRHVQLYTQEVLGKLKQIRGGIRGGIIFLDEKMKNELNTQNPVKNAQQLKLMVDEWMRSIFANEEEKYDILKILNVEMWGEDKSKRGFPLPRNKELVISYLTKSLGYLKEARSNLDEHATLDSVPAL